MKIAILGANGFIGSSLSTHLKKAHNVIPYTRSNINLLDPVQVKDALEKEKFDVIINCAATMASDEFKNVKNDLSIFMNFYSNKHLFFKFINLTSGADLDREYDLFNEPEESVTKRIPQDGYGFVQNIKSRICLQEKNFLNLRIFNCFGKGELPTRIFPAFLNRKETFVIQNDRFFDYFFIEDLCEVINYFVENDEYIKDMNCVYHDKYKISEVMHLFCTVHELKHDFIIGSTQLKNYTGDGSLLKNMNLNIIGLREGLRKYML